MISLVIEIYCNYSFEDRLSVGRRKINGRSRGMNCKGLCMRFERRIHIQQSVPAVESVVESVLEGLRNVVDVAGACNGMIEGGKAR